MAQATTTVPTKNTGDELNATELNDINDTLNSNATDSETRLSSLESETISVAVIEDQKPSGTPGGTSVGGLNKRDLNTIIFDEDSIINALGNNEFILEAGTYLIEATAPSHKSDGTSIQLNRDGVGYTKGSNTYASQISSASGNCHLYARVVSTGSEVWALYTLVATGTTTNGLGVNSNAGVEIYTQVKITKIG